MNTNDIWLIAGLGNPETKYDGTRHNAGYAALDYLADKWGISVSKTKFEGLWGQGEVDGHKVVLLKPLTYMNLSGDSIAPTAGFFKIPADHVIVLCDDITQNPGKLRIRPSGSAGGHNGLKSIIARLGGENFPRIRIGVGAKPHPDYDLAAWVLGKFPAEDAKALSGRYPDLEAAAKLIMDGKLSLAQSKYNGEEPHLKRPPLALWAFSAEFYFYCLCLSRPAGRSKHIFTEWGSTGKLHLCSLMHFEVTPPLVKKQQRIARRLFSAANKK